MSWLEGALLTALAIVALLYWALATAPSVDPERCWDPEITSGRAECGGPCTQGKVPCARE